MGKLEDLERAEAMVLELRDLIETIFGWDGGDIFKTGSTFLTYNDKLLNLRSLLRQRRRALGDAKLTEWNLNASITPGVRVLEPEGAKNGVEGQWGRGGKSR